MSEFAAPPTPIPRCVRPAWRRGVATYRTEGRSRGGGPPGLLARRSVHVRVAPMSARESLFSAKKRVNRTDPGEIYSLDLKNAFLIRVRLCIWRTRIHVQITFYFYPLCTEPPYRDNDYRNLEIFNIRTVRCKRIRAMQTSLYCCNARPYCFTRHDPTQFIRLVVFCVSHFRLTHNAFILVITFNVPFD